MENNSSILTDETDSETGVPDKKGKRKKMSKTRSMRKKVTEEQDQDFLESLRKKDIKGLKTHFHSFKDAKMAPDSKEAQYLKIAITGILILEAKKPLEENDHKRIRDIQELLNHPLCDINRKDRKGSAPIHQAVNFENVELVRMLLSVKGIDLNQFDDTNIPPIHRAIVLNNRKIFRMLLEAEGINVNLLDKCGFAPIHKAIKICSSEFVSMLLKHRDIDLSVLDKDGIPLMRYLMRFYDKEIWKSFMDGPITEIDVNATDRNGYTTLHYALCYAGDPKQAPMEAVLTLLDHKDIDVNVVAPNFATPLAALLFNKNFNEGLCLKLLNHKKLQKLTADYVTELNLFAYVVGNSEGRNLLKKNLLNKQEPSSSNQWLSLTEYRLRLWHAWSKFRQKIASPTQSTQGARMCFSDLKDFSRVFKMVRRHITNMQEAPKRKKSGIAVLLRRCEPLT